MKRYLGELIKQKYIVDDLPLSDFTGEVIRAYEVQERRAAPDSLQSGDEPLSERDCDHLQNQQTPDYAHCPAHLLNPLPLARRKPEKRLEYARPRQRQNDRTLRPRPRLLHPPRHERHSRHPQPRQKPIKIIRCRPWLQNHRRPRPNPRSSGQPNMSQQRGTGRRGK